jgi:steroid delta-isomerase
MSDLLHAPMNEQAALLRVVDFYESLSRESVPALGQIYTEEAFFKDPFNEVTGLPQIIAIFSHMYDQVDAPRFVVTHKMVNGTEGFMTWDFMFRMKRYAKQEQCIRGATHLQFAPDGRICMHRDYWDAAEELYEKLPLLGSLMRWLKRAARS